VQYDDNRKLEFYFFTPINIQDITYCPLSIGAATGKDVQLRFRAFHENFAFKALTYKAQLEAKINGRWDLIKTLDLNLPENKLDDILVYWTLIENDIELGRQQKSIVAANRSLNKFMNELLITGRENIELMRKILMSLTEDDSDEYRRLTIAGFKSEDISHNSRLLIKEGLAVGMEATGNFGGGKVKIDFRASLSGLTEKGKEFLNRVKSERDWKSIKGIVRDNHKQLTLKNIIELTRPSEETLHSPAGDVAEQSEQNVFQFTDVHWCIVFEGRELPLFDNDDGFYYIHQLLKNKGTPVDASQLQYWKNNTDFGNKSKLGEIVDKKCNDDFNDPRKASIENECDLTIKSVLGDDKDPEDFRIAKRFWAYGTKDLEKRCKELEPFRTPNRRATPERMCKRQ
jgi:hypothetical protein